MLKNIVIILCLILWPLNFILNFSRTDFKTETVFKNDYQAEQLVLRNIQLYPTPLLARIFQNKARIYLNKYASNFFTITDPNYYFFALHPTPIPGSLNLSKFPFLSIIFFIYGLLVINNVKNFKYILIFLVFGIFSLPMLKNFEGWGFIMYLPMSFIIVNGILMFSIKKPFLFKYFCYVFILFSVPEIIRIFYIK